MIIVNRIDARDLFLKAAQDKLRKAQNKVDFDLELVDLGIEGDRPGQIADWGVRSKQTGAILFRSFYNRLPVVTLAEAYAAWVGGDVPF